MGGPFALATAGAALQQPIAGRWPPSAAAVRHQCGPANLGSQRATFEMALGAALQNDQQPKQHEQVAAEHGMQHSAVKSFLSAAPGLAPRTSRQ